MTPEEPIGHGGEVAREVSTEAKLGEPYCAKCGYALGGAVLASACPECGTPLVECLVRRAPSAGKTRVVRYKSPQRIFGMPLVSVAFGPDLDRGEQFGRAKGWIAIGDSALGGLAIGMRAAGIVAIGQASAGLFSIGGLTFGAVSAFGGMAAGGYVFGGMAAGVVTTGGMSAGVVAKGGMVAGVYAAGGRGFGPHVIDMSGRQSVEAANVFASMQAWNGPPIGSVLAYVQPAVVSLFALVVAAMVVLMIAVWGHWRSGKKEFR